MLIRQNRGFTLIELVMSVVIIGTLSCFALYNYQANNARAKIYSTKATMSDVIMAAEAYADSNHGRYPATPDELVEYATRDPNFANMRNAYDHQSVWMNLNGTHAGDISYHALLDTTGTPVGYRIEARGRDDWLPTILERRPRTDSF